MHKCILIKLGGKQKNKLGKTCKLNENRGKLNENGEIYKFCGNGGIFNMHHGLKGDGHPWIYDL